MRDIHRSWGVRRRYRGQWSFLRTALSLALLVWVPLTANAAPAAADSPLEGIWSFTGGKVAIQAEGAGLVGIVVVPTKFAECTHPVGERMWTEIRRQPDGSYWGLHQWFFATDECVPNPTLGLTAWRVLQAADGERFLRVCFSNPESTSQPTIAPDGTTAGATFGCVDSALVGGLPAVSSAQFGRYVNLPPKGQCLSRSKLRIHIRDPKNDPLKRVSVSLRKGSIHRRARIERRGKRITATLNLDGLPAGPFIVKVRLTTVLGEHLTGGRRYIRCGGPAGRSATHHGHRRR